MLSAMRLLAVATCASLVSAQLSSTCCGITPSSVDQGIRSSWCQAEFNTCLQLCPTFQTNNCSAETLEYMCVCHDGTSPNMSDYQQSLPAMQCQAWVDQCVRSSGTDAIKINACRSVKCGNRTDATAAASTTTTSLSQTPSSSSSSSSSSAGAATSSPSSTPAAAVALTFAKTYGTGALAAGLLAAFGMAL